VTKRKINNSTHKANSVTVNSEHYMLNSYVRITLTLAMTALTVHAPTAKPGTMWNYNW